MAPVVTLLSIFSIIISLTHSIPATPLILHLPNTTALLNASSLTQNDRCDTSKTQSWQAYAFLVEDCFVAVLNFFIEHVQPNPDEIFEFSMTGTARRFTRYPRVKTPDVYTHESCTLAIVMLDWFAPGQLPGDAHFTYSAYDTSTAKELWRAAKKVEDRCLEPPRRMPGWEVAGQKGNIGVFLWATESGINKMVTGMVGAGGMLGGNGSDSGAVDGGLDADMR